MRRTAVLHLVAVGMVALAIAGCGDETRLESGSDPEGGVAVRVRGTVRTTDAGSEVCPSAIPPCWPIEPNPVRGIAAGAPVLVEGRLVDGRLHLDGQPSPLPEPFQFSNPCGDKAGAMAGGENGDEAVVGVVGHYAETIPDQFAGRWLARPGPVVVLAVTADADRHRRALAALGADEGVCVTDEGFRFTETELQRVQAEVVDRFSEWSRMGWHASSAGIDAAGNRVRVEVDQADPRLRDELDRRWPDRIELLAAVEVLDGTIADLPEPSGGDIEIPTGSRGGVHLDALGRFTLRHDRAHDCVYAEAGSGRIEVVWPYGARALRDPVRIVDADGKVLATVDQPFEIGGGGTGAPRADDPLACGATSVWVT